MIIHRKSDGQLLKTISVLFFLWLVYNGNIQLVKNPLLYVNYILTELTSNIFWVLACEIQSILPSLYRIMKQRNKLLSFPNLKNPIVKKAVIRHYQKIKAI